MHTPNLHNILFLDIETVSQKSDFDELNQDWQHLWEDKTKFIRYEGETAADFYPKRAAILAEFGKIVCISCGFFTKIKDETQFRVTSFYDEDEAQLLIRFATQLALPFYENFVLCAHNGKEFDFPYIARRMLINGLNIPQLLDTSGSKPWEVPHLDTLQMWKFGDYKHYTSLKLLAAIFDIPTPKDDIDGSQVGSVFWEEKDLPRIVRYCEKDTVTVARIYLKLKSLPPLPDDIIHWINGK